MKKLLVKIWQGINKGIQKIPPDIKGFLIGELLGIWFLWKAMNIPPSRASGGALFFAILFAILWRQHIFISEIQGKINEILEKRMDKIIEFTTLGNTTYFREHLEKTLKQYELGNLRWAVAKFISYKLNKDFNHAAKIEIENVSATEYSQLLAKLIQECSESIYMTCPYTPYDWLKKLIKDPCGSCNNPTDSCSYKLELEHLPEHIKAFCSSKVKNKMRIVNIEMKSIEDFKNLIKNNQATCYKNFINYYKNSTLRNLETEHNIKIRFVLQKDLEDGDLKDDDYNILDGKLVMKWDIYSENPNTCTLIDKAGSECLLKKGNKNCEIAIRKGCPLNVLGKCTLIFDKGEIERHMKIFRNIDASHYKKIKDISDS